MAKVLVPLGEECEELEAVTIVDLLRRAGVTVVTAALEGDPIIRASRGVTLVADALLAEVRAGDFDMIALPGGRGADRLDRDPKVRELLTAMAADGKFVAAVCAAPKVLAHAGLLRGRRATCFPGAITDARAAGVTLEDAPVVQDGKVITSRGPGTAMDFALTLVEALAGRTRRAEVEAALVR